MQDQDQSSALRITLAECLELANKYLDLAKTAVHPNERFEITRMAIHCNAAAFELETYLRLPSGSDPHWVEAAWSRPVRSSAAAELLLMRTVARLREQAATLCERAKTFSDATLREHLLVLRAECEKLGPTSLRRGRSAESF
jgi:hypothetical protein